MIDWRHGGWTGSMNRFARREVREHLHGNAAARRTRYSLARRFVHWFSHIGTFARLISLYLVLDFAIIGAEVLYSLNPDPIADWLTVWGDLNSVEISFSETILRSISGYFIGAQVGALGVITLALALVALIARGENSSTDIRIYYHESLAFQVIASCLALLAVLVTQLVWPLQVFLHSLGFGSDHPIFEYVIMLFHLVWLLMNISVLSYFIVTTFRFVQQSERETLRERYTSNVILPRDLLQRLREHLYSLATHEIGDEEDDISGNQPRVTFGFDCGEPYIIEIEATFARTTALNDVRMAWVLWVIRRWSQRCAKTDQASSCDLVQWGTSRPQICFTLRIDQKMKGKVGWCRRRGGVPLNWIEKQVLRGAFVFARAHHET